MKDIKTYEIYLVGDVPHGHEVEAPYPASLRGFDISYDFPGKSFHMVIVSNDDGIDRAIALRFATAIAFGTFKTFRVDLLEVSRHGKRRMP